MRKAVLLFLFLFMQLGAAPKVIDFSMIISGGVSLGAYEAGYNWAMIKMLSEMRDRSRRFKPELKSVTGASAGSINSLLTAVYWCQKKGAGVRNGVEDNLFFDTWVKLGLDDLMVKENETDNKSTLFSRRVLRKKAGEILKYMRRDIYRYECEVPLGIAVTKVKPIIERFNNIDIKNQAFNIPLTLKVKNGRAYLSNRKMPEDDDLMYLSIPGIDKDYSKIADILFASSAFPAAFEQVKLDYAYEGKAASGYFIDGGIYNNAPLNLANALDDGAEYFLFISPDNMRRKYKPEKDDRIEKAPIGFLSSNLYPLANVLDIYQQMNLYRAIKRYFKHNPKHKLILSSRYHPLTAGFLQHFGAFLDINFRYYDYHVGVYDAIYHLARSLSGEKAFAKMKQEKIMIELAKIVGLKESGEAMTAFRFFLATEFHHKKIPGNNRYASIYNAFEQNVPKSRMYSIGAFKEFLQRLDMRYLDVSPGSFLYDVRKDPDRWYAELLQYISLRVTTLENIHAEEEHIHSALSAGLDMAAWGTSTYYREKEGWQFFAIHAPHEEKHSAMRNALRFLPSEISADVANGGFSLGYDITWYGDIGFFDGLEFRTSYNHSNDDTDFLRLDADIFKEYGDTFKVGVGMSAFGDMDSRFYNSDTAYGANIYVDFMEIFRAKYVWRHGDGVDNSYLYFGIENIPSLLYWLGR